MLRLPYSFSPRLRQIPEYAVIGRVASIVGALVEVKGLNPFLRVGARCSIGDGSRSLVAEVIGFKEEHALLMPFERIEGIGPGFPVTILSSEPVVMPHQSWLGRVLDAEANPIDGKGVLQYGEDPYSVHALPIPAYERRRVGARLDMGVRAINTFTTLCRGQRMGVFAGSGVGKSVLLSMITRFTEADVIVIGLIGERGREVQEFLEDNLDEESLKRAVIVVATSDESAMRRKSAAYMTLTLAEFYRDQGLEVLCLMDSVTRFAMAQREIGLATGEPASTKGYTPSVFAELPRLLERAGPGREGQGNITGVFTVLVEGDDHNEPISDTVRGILDGHIVLDRKLAERGHYPAINVLRSISRTMPRCHSAEENELIKKLKNLLSLYEDMADMIRLGAYRQGSDPKVDEAIRYFPKITQVLQQSIHENSTIEQSFSALQAVFSSKG